MFCFCNFTCSHTFNNTMEVKIQIHNLISFGIEHVGPGTVAVYLNFCLVKGTNATWRIGKILFPLCMIFLYLNFFIFWPFKPQNFWPMEMWLMKDLSLRTLGVTAVENSLRVSRREFLWSAWLGNFSVLTFALRNISKLTQ